ncbi:hypothetical protein AAY473_008311 [Plecturocebus cupreus]
MLARMCWDYRHEPPHPARCSLLNTGPCTVPDQPLSSPASGSRQPSCTEGQDGPCSYPFHRMSLSKVTSNVNCRRPNLWFSPGREHSVDKCTCSDAVGPHALSAVVSVMKFINPIHGSHQLLPGLFPWSSNSLHALAHLSQSSRRGHGVQCEFRGSAG